jgi:hypothetical protein
MKNPAKYSGPPAPDPFSIPDSIMIIFIVAAFFFLLLIFRRRKTIRFRVLRGIVVMGSGFGIIYSLLLRGDNRFIAMLAGTAAMTIVDLLLFPSQKRPTDIPRSERKKVIAAFEARRGKKFDPKRHAIAYIVPVSEGGKPTADNLRVIRRSDRSKTPWWELPG